MRNNHLSVKFSWLNGNIDVSYDLYKIHQQPRAIGCFHRKQTAKIVLWRQAGEGNRENIFFASCFCM